MWPGQLLMRKYSEAGLFVALQGIKVEKKEIIHVLIHVLFYYFKLNIQMNDIYPWLLVWSDSGYLRRSSAVVIAAAADCVSAPDSGPVSDLLTAHHAAAASAPSAYATSEMTSGIWLDSRPQPAAQPELSLWAVEGAVSLQLQVMGMMWRPRWRQERGHWWMRWWLCWHWADQKLWWKPGWVLLWWQVVKSLSR